MKPVEFKINPKEEARNLPDLLGWAGYDFLTKEARKKISWITKKQLYLELKKLHKKPKIKLEKSKNFSENYWKNIENEFFKILEDSLEIKLERNKTVYFTPIFVCSIADVVRRKNAYIKETYNERQLTFVVLHELIHLHYADSLHELKLEQALVSPLVEGVDYVLLFRTPLKNLLHPSVTYEKQPFTQKNPKFMNELNKLWDNRKSYRDFIEKAIKLNDKTTGVIIC